MESTSNKSFAWAPATNLGHKTGNVQQVQSFGQLGKCCEKYGAMGCFASDFPTFLLHVNVVTRFLFLYLGRGVQDLRHRNVPQGNRRQ